MKKELSSSELQIIQQQIINETEPGNILRDFEILLRFVAANELKVSGVKQLLPQSILGELNESLTNPISIAIQRPVQKSYPNVNGLYLVLRASGLARIEPRGKHAVLTLNEQMMQRWQELNPAERYIALLEVWLVHGSDEILGEHDPHGSFHKCNVLWHKLAEKKTLIFGQKRDDNSGLNYYPGLHNLALMELFGLVRVSVAKPTPGEGWNVKKIESSPFGLAMSHLLQNKFSEQLEAGIFWRDFGEDTSFSLFSVLQPYFPLLKNQLTLPLPAKREGVFTFKVSLGKIWRRIAIPSGLTLYDLSLAILDSVEFDNDHLHQFTYRNQIGRQVMIEHSYCEEDLSTEEVGLSDISLQVGESMKYLFDFGDCWEFNVALESFDPVKSRRKKAVLLESHGKAPEQYPSWDDDDDESDEDEDFDE